jgi:hypothetical protein
MGGQIDILVFEAIKPEIREQVISMYVTDQGRSKRMYGIRIPNKRRNRTPN